ncbi:MAG TPA: HigA family addiction module antitoxin [Bryobacteraceae bacterium]|nr:HigA family addiction module antitoxin [Bryobacteraceae bacterium]
MPEKSSPTNWKRSGCRRKKLADFIDVPPNRLYQLIAGKRSMTADTALRLTQYSGTSLTFWMHLQSAFELDLAGRDL